MSKMPTWGLVAFLVLCLFGLSLLTSCKYDPGYYQDYDTHDVHHHHVYHHTTVHHHVYHHVYRTTRRR